jgi:DNA modification methylase
MINTVICGRAEAVLKDIPEGYIDLTVTSPPYDNLRKYQGYVFDFETIARELYRVTKPGGVLVWVVGDSTKDGSESTTSAEQKIFFRNIGFSIHDTMIWMKGTAPFQHKNRYINGFEYMFVLSKGNPTTFNLIKDRKNKWAGTKIHGTERQTNGKTKPLSEVQKSKNVKEFGARLNIWEIQPCKTNKSGHPAPFPEQLAEDHILSWSNPGDVVLDPMAGSGTTLKMAKLNGRNYIGIELSEMYVNEIIIPRLASEATALVAGE